MLQDRYIGTLYLHIFIMYTRRQSEGVATVQRRPVYRVYYYIPCEWRTSRDGGFYNNLESVRIYMYIISPAKIKA